MVLLPELKKRKMVKNHWRLLLLIMPDFTWPQWSILIPDPPWKQWRWCQASRAKAPAIDPLAELLSWSHDPLVVVGWIKTVYWPLWRQRFNTPFCTLFSAGLSLHCVVELLCFIFSRDRNYWQAVTDHLWSHQSLPGLGAFLALGPDMTPQLLSTDGDRGESGWERARAKRGRAEAERP